MAKSAGGAGRVGRGARVGTERVFGDRTYIRASGTSSIGTGAGQRLNNVGNWQFRAPNGNLVAVKDPSFRARLDRGLDPRG